MRLRSKSGQRGYLVSDCLVIGAGLSGVEQVGDRRKDLPEELLDTVLLGIREPKELSLHALKERLVAAIDPHPCAPEASALPTEWGTCVGDAAEASAAAPHAAAAAAAALTETAHGGSWFAHLAQSSEAVQEAAAGVEAETGLEAAVDVAGQCDSPEPTREASEDRLGQLPAAAAGSDAPGFARWDASTEVAFGAAPRLVPDAEWAAGEHALSVVAQHVSADAAWNLGGQASIAETQRGSVHALQLLQACRRASAASVASTASEFESVLHTIPLIWGPGELTHFNAAE